MGDGGRVVDLSRARALRAAERVVSAADALGALTDPESAAMAETRRELAVRIMALVDATLLLSSSDPLVTAMFRIHDAFLDAHEPGTRTLHQAVEELRALNDG